MSIARRNQVGAEVAVVEDAALGALWEQLSAADWSNNSAAYATAIAARRIIERASLTIAAFASECRSRRISGFGSQGAVSRRLRWADLHDELWAKGILPAGAFISEDATRPLYDRRLRNVDRLKALGAVFAPYMGDDARRRFADSLTKAVMSDLLADYADRSLAYRAPRTLMLPNAVARILAAGYTADQVCATAHQLEDEAARVAAVNTTNARVEGMDR
jgi:hypothetical protein